MHICNLRSRIPRSQSLHNSSQREQFPEVAEVYPKGIHGCIADFLKEAGMDVKTATLREPEHGWRWL